MASDRIGAASVFLGRPPAGTAYQTSLGRMMHGSAEDVLSARWTQRLKGQVQLILTSPPFPLNRRKSYGNRSGAAYAAWLSEFARIFRGFLSRRGSIVLELGNAWESGSPTMSTLPLETLLKFKKAGDLHLCQEFVWYNPARLPSPVQWVNIERIRVKDAFTRLWWMSPVERPAACNRRVLREYSDDMKRLLSRGEYRGGKRPSGHEVGAESFLKDNGGAIPPNVLRVSNTRSAGAYYDFCKSRDFRIHPARMPTPVAEFFIRFLTEEGDLVLDPFAGSNVTGYAAEMNHRQWLSVEPEGEYVAGSRGRFRQVSEIMNPDAG